MKTQAERDEQTVTIATTLALVIVVMLVGVAALWLHDVISDPSDKAQTTIFVATLTAAVLVSGRYLIRHRRP